MKIFVKNIFIFLIIGLSFYFISSCSKDENIVKNEPVDLGILRTNEFGQVLGGDTTDWCIHALVDTFTYVISFNVTVISNNISKLEWKTSKQYHCFGFDIERSLKPDSNNYTKIGFISGVGITNDTISFNYYDTVSLNVSYYKYRLKVIDIYGNFRYWYTVMGITLIGGNNYSFGPAYPNPVYTNFNLPCDIPKDDTVSIFILNGFDTIFFIKNERIYKGSYMIGIYNNYNFHNVQKRLYIKCSSLPISDSCRNYGDIQFE
ncbi:MAG: hypothetical protein WC358_10450 [Ignavibacteria bacterium]|jgi:hypothetical protein